MSNQTSFASRFTAIALIVAILAVWYAFNPLGVLAFSVPVAVDDTPAQDVMYTTTEDSALHVNGLSVLANDTSDEGDVPLSIGVVGPVAHGSVVFNADKSFDYTPNADFNGTDTFTYTAGDGISTSTPATVSILVTPVNDAPVATNQSVVTSVNLASSSVLTANDIDVGDTLSYATTSNPTHGTTVLNAATGAFTYTPSASYVGTDSFTWQASDGAASSSVATVNITVVPAPVIGISLIFINDNGGIATTSTIFLDGSTTTGATTTVTVGTHTVSGSDIPNYTSTIGADCSAGGNVTIAMGSSKLCVITYDDVASGGGTSGPGIEDKKPANGPISSIGPSFGTISNFSGFGSGSVLGASTSLPELPPGCSPLLNGFMRRQDRINKNADVEKLQKFLNDAVHTNLEITGLFGAETDAAVRKFQSQNADEILSPWGLKNPTGFVYLTTQRWINLKSCATLDIPMPKLVPYRP